MERINKTDVPFLVKDNYSGAVLNTNVEALQAYKAKKKKLNEKLSRIDKLEIDVLQMKTEIKSQSKDCHEIKSMLVQLLGKIDGWT